MFSPDKLTLGTVQFGLNYGINNSGGQVSTKEAFKILDFAYEVGIRTIDTADVYGNSQEVIASYLKQTSKDFEILSKFHINDSFKNVEISLNNTLNRLGLPYINTYSYHNFKNYIDSPETFNQLKEQKDLGKIKHTGISVYTNEELIKCLNNDEINSIQLPFNLLDNDNQRGEILSSVKNKEIHTRSVFLQGLFFKDINALPEKLIPLKDNLKEIQTLAKEYKLSMSDLSLLYPMTKGYINKVIIGVDTVNQLKQNISSLGVKIDVHIFEKIDKIRVKHTELLTPNNW